MAKKQLGLLQIWLQSELTLSIAKLILKVKCRKVQQTFWCFWLHSRSFWRIPMLDLRSFFSSSIHYVHLISTEWCCEGCYWRMEQLKTILDVCNIALMLILYAKIVFLKNLTGTSTAVMACFNWRSERKSRKWCENPD